MAAPQEKQPISWRRDTLTGGVEELFGTPGEIVPQPDGSYTQLISSNVVEEGTVRVMTYRPSAYESNIWLLKVYRFTAEGRQGDMVIWRNHGFEPVVSAEDMQRFLSDGIAFAGAFRKHTQEQYHPELLQDKYMDITLILREKLGAARELPIQPDILVSLEGALEEISRPVV